MFLFHPVFTVFSVDALGRNLVPAKPKASIRVVDINRPMLVEVAALDAASSLDREVASRGRRHGGSHDGSRLGPEEVRRGVRHDWIRGLGAASRLGRQEVRRRGRHGRKRELDLGSQDRSHETAGVDRQHGKGDDDERGKRKEQRQMLEL